MVSLRSVLSALGVGLVGAASLAAEQPAATPLLPGRSVERRIAPGERQAYEVRVEAGQFLRVVLERRGIEVLLILEGSPFDRVDRGTPTGPYGTVVVVGIAREAGVARLVVHDSNAGVPGAYKVTLVDLRAENANDRLRQDAQRLASSFEWFAQTGEGRAKAVRLGAEAADLYRQALDDRGTAEQLLVLAFNQFYSGKSRDALPTFREALDLWRKLGDRTGEANTLNGMGMAYSYLADYPKALEQYRSSLQVEESLGDPWGQARVLSNMSVAYASVGEYEKARECLEQSLPLRRAAGDRRGEGYSLANLADYEATGNLGRRIELKSRAAELFRQAGDQFAEAHAVADLGLLYARAGDDARAFQNLETARPLLKEAGNPRMEGRVVSQVGALEEREGKPREALAAYAEALELHRKAKDRGGEALTLLRAGRAHARLGEEPEARAAYSRSLDVCRTIASPFGQAEVLANLAKLEMGLGRRTQARAALDQAIELIESLRRRISRREDRALFFSRWQEAYRLSTQLYLEENDARPGGGFDARAFRETERARARALAESVADADVRIAGDLPADLRSREAELSARLTDLQKRLAAAEEGDRRAIEEEVFQTEAAWQSLLVEVRARSRRYASLQYPEAITAEQARAACDPETAIVSYALGESVSHVFVLTRAGLTVVALPVAFERLSEEISSFVGLLSNPSGEAPQGLAIRLDEELVEPWRKNLPASIRRLVIVPEGDLHSMPFELLPQSSRGGRRILEDFVVSYVPSVTILSELASLSRPSTAGRPVDVLAFAAPPSPEALTGRGATFDGERVELGPVPRTEDEARFAALSGGAASRVYTGPGASERQLKKERLERYGVLHFATHTVLSPHVPSRSALVLAEGEREDGLLQAREIYLLTLRAEMVVLSGCRTARGRVLAGEGVEGLAQAFFHAGARTVVATLWDVSDQRTAELMEAFYRHLALGEPKAEALRSAKLDALRREPGLAPHFWAPFVVIGEPAATVPLRPVSWWRRLFG